MFCFFLSKIIDNYIIANVLLYLVISYSVVTLIISIVSIVSIVVIIV